MLQHKYHFRYFSKHVDREVKEVYGETVIATLALSLVFIFEPIYLYSLGFSLSKILWFYMQVYTAYILLAFFGAKFASNFGYKHSILTSNILYIFYWLSLYFIKDYHFLFFIAPVLFALQKSFFWPAYNADVAWSSKGEQRGREVSVLYSLIEVTFIIGPILGGFISKTFGFLALFVSASILIMISAWPLFQSKEIYGNGKFSFKYFLSAFKKYPRNLFAYFGYAEDLMVMSLWPIYIFIVVPDFFKVGGITTVTTIVATLIMLYFGKLADYENKSRLLKWSSVLYGLTWMFRFIATKLSAVIVFDALTKLGKDVVHVPMEAMTFEAASSKDRDFALAYGTFYEVSLAIGKVVTALTGIIILSLTGSLGLVFAAVGVLTMFYGFLKSK